MGYAAGTSDVRPVDADAFTFHAAEPCHLAFGELMDRCGKLRAHFFQCEFSGHMEGDELVFNP